MKFLRPRSADSGLVTVLLVSDAELAMLSEAVARLIAEHAGLHEAPPWKKILAELKTARKAL